MTNQVDKVLDIANMSKEIVFCPIDTKEVVNNTIQMLDSQIKQANAKVYINELPNQIIANEVSIIKVFQNLISNGIKFNDKDQIKIEISGEETPSEWLFKIKDNGNGIDHSFQDQIFHFGEQVIPGNKGNGIGLNTCSKLVKLHMGKIWMNSTLGKGSEFIFSINKNLNPV